MWRRRFARTKDFGTIEPGKVADIIAIEGDPLKDMWAVQNVKTVILNGRIVDIEFIRSTGTRFPSSEDRGSYGIARAGGLWRAGRAGVSNLSSRTSPHRRCRAGGHLGGAALPPGPARPRRVPPASLTLTTRIPRGGRGRSAQGAHSNARPVYVDLTVTASDSSLLVKQRRNGLRR